MSAPPKPAVDSWYLLVLKAAVTMSAVFLFVYPLANWQGQLAAVLAVPAAYGLAWLAQRARIRSLPVIGAMLVSLGIGLFADRMLGEPEWIAAALGASTLLNVISVVTFAALVFGVIFPLRVLVLRQPTFVVLEAACLVGIVVLSFLGHRDSNIGQPRDFADWAFGTGYDPRFALRWIGVITAGSILIIMLRTTRVKQTVIALTALACLLYGLFVLSIEWLPDLNKQVQLTNKDQPNPPINDKQQPLPDRDHLSFNPHDWPDKPRAMAIVTLKDDFRPASGYFYFRQDAFSQFNGTKLVRGVDQGVDLDLAREFAVAKTEFPLPAFQEKLQAKVPMTISLLQPHLRPFGLTNVKTMSPADNLKPDTFLRTYEVEAQTLQVSATHNLLQRMPSGNSSWTKEQLALYLHGPSDPRYKELADKILSEIDWQRFKPEYRNSATLRALTIRRWIEKNMTYNLAADHRGAEDPVASFLFGSRQGFCVHVAHAMTYLLRSAGIPARTAAGYMADSARVGNGSGILLQCTDLHAWCEIYLEGLGWVVMDAALENSVTRDPPPVDLTEQQFYNEQNRKPFEPPQAQSALMAWLAEIPLTAVLAGLLVIVASLYSIKVWRRLAPRFAAESQLYRVCYRAALDRLAEIGLSRRLGETREEFAERCVAWNPEFALLTTAHVRQAVTGEMIPEARNLQDLLAETTRRISTAIQFRRRIAGVANPLSWLHAR